MVVVAFAHPHSVPHPRHPETEQRSVTLELYIKYSVTSKSISSKTFTITLEQSHFVNNKTHFTISSYILWLRSGSAGPSAAHLWPHFAILPQDLTVDSGGLAISLFQLVVRTRAAGEEPSTKAAFVRSVPAAFDWNAAWAGYVGCF